MILTWSLLKSRINLRRAGVDMLDDADFLTLLSFFEDKQSTTTAFSLLRPQVKSALDACQVRSNFFVNLFRH